MEQQTHKRRVRYKGTHPRTYQEKYKELNPEKYKDTIEHVIQKGNTPAGMHISICVKEILDFLQIRPDRPDWCNARLWRTFHRDVKMFRGQGTFVCFRC